MVEANQGEEDLEFKWGRKRGVGGKKKNVQFYESFIYDGVEYFLYDSVFLYKEGEPEPFIGKIIKIWENADKSKKVKLLWYFRPCEILNFLGGCKTLDNELFLASGEGLGLSNVNPLEAIAGKCNVVCISKDKRNPHPSDEDLQMAEFVFHRFFDVGHRKISDTIDDKIAGVEVKNIFNNLDSQKLVGPVKLGLDKKEVSGNDTVPADAVAHLSQKNTLPLIEKPDRKCLVRENPGSRPLLGEKLLLSVGLKESWKSNDRLHPISNEEIQPQAKVRENGLSKASLVKQKSFTKLSRRSGDDSEQTELTKTNDRGRRGNESIEETILRSRVDFGRVEDEVGGVHVEQANWGLDEKTFEKEKPGGSSKVSSAKIKNNLQKRRLGTCGDDVKSVARSSSRDKEKHLHARDLSYAEEVSSKKLKIGKSTKLSNDKLRRESSIVSPNVEHKLDNQRADATRRPDVDRSRWFKGFPWAERMKTAYEQGRLVLLENLDPSLTSSEVQDIIWQGFKENCTAKMVQKSAYSSPHSGQAFVIFKRKEAAELVVRKLDEGCLLMSNGRPLVGSFRHPCFPEKKRLFHGHHVVDQLRLQMQRDMKDAVSTSHCSQPNNIEYDMAIEWCLQQERTDRSWRRLYKRQGEELSKLKAKLKSKNLSDPQ